MEESAIRMAEGAIQAIRRECNSAIPLRQYMGWEAGRITALQMLFPSNIEIMGWENESNFLRHSYAPRHEIER